MELKLKQEIELINKSFYNFIQEQQEKEKEIFKKYKNLADFVEKQINS